MFPENEEAPDRPASQVCQARVVPQDGRAPTDSPVNEDSPDCRGLLDPLA